MKDNSYTELSKISAMNQSKGKENSVQNQYIEMLLEEIQLGIEKEKLLNQIDLTLDQRDQEAFMRFSKQYIELNKRLKNKQ